MTRVQIQPEVLDWAAYQAGLSLREFAEQISTRDTEKILNGSLSEAQVHKATRLAKIKFYELFLDLPPARQTVPLTDFRTLPEKRPLSKDFFDVYNDILYKQEWYKDFLIKEGADNLSFIGKYKNITNHKKIAAELRKKLFIDSKPTTANDFNTYYSFLAQNTEALGVLVFKNGIVGNNTHRPLDVNEFRGFTICDQVAPVIFINGKDSASAWIFTLIHELAHLLRGESAISDASNNSTNREEILCNKIAAEVLVPESDFALIWNRTPNSNVNDKLFEAQNKFNVSLVVIARRAFDMGYISHDLYLEKSRIKPSNILSKTSKGGDFYASLNIKNSKTLTKTVSQLAAAGTLSFKEAGRLLQVAPTNIMKVYKKNKNALST